MRLVAIATIGLLVGCASRRGVTETPRWQSEPDELRFELIGELLAGNEVNRALTLLKVLQDEGVDDARMPYYQAMAYRKQGMLDQAVVLIDEATRRSPRSGKVALERCVLHADRGEMDSAIDACGDAVKWDDESAPAWNNYGFLLWSAGARLPEAVDALRTAVSLDGNEPQYRNNLAFALAQSGMTDEALRTFLTTSSTADAHYNVGTAFERQGDVANALVYYQQALKHQDAHPSAAEAVARLNESETP